MSIGRVFGPYKDPGKDPPDKHDRKFVTSGKTPAWLTDLVKLSEVDADGYNAGRWKTMREESLKSATGGRYKGSPLDLSEVQGLYCGARASAAGPFWKALQSCGFTTVHDSACGVFSEMQFAHDAGFHATGYDPDPDMRAAARSLQRRGLIPDVNIKRSVTHEVGFVDFDWGDWYDHELNDLRVADKRLILSLLAHPTTVGAKISVMKVPKNYVPGIMSTDTLIKVSPRFDSSVAYLVMNLRLSTLSWYEVVNQLGSSLDVIHDLMPVSTFTSDSFLTTIKQAGGVILRLLGEVINELAKGIDDSDETFETWLAEHDNKEFVSHSFGQVGRATILGKALWIPYHITNGRPFTHKGKLYKASFVSALKDLTGYGVCAIDGPKFVGARVGDEAWVVHEGVKHLGKVLASSPVQVAFSGKPIQGLSGSPIMTNKGVIMIYSCHRNHGDYHVSMSYGMCWEEAVLSQVESKGAINLSVPCGFGKSTYLIKSLNASIPGKILVIEPRSVLPQSIAKSIGRDAAGFSGEEPIDLSSKVIFISHGKFLSYEKSGTGYFNAFDLIVVDEAHDTGDLTIVTKEVISQAYSHKKIIFMTATPSDDDFLERTSSSSVFAREVVELPDSQPLSGSTIVNLLEGLYKAKPTSSIIVQVPNVSFGEKMSRFLGFAKVIHLNRQALNDGLSYEGVEKDMRSDDFVVVFSTPVIIYGVTLPADVLIIQGQEMAMHSPIGEKSFSVLKTLSQSSRNQWAGRVGRIKDGVVIQPRLKWELNVADDASLLTIEAWKFLFGLDNTFPYTYATKRQVETALALPISFNCAIGLVTKDGIVIGDSPFINRYCDKNKLARIKGRAEIKLYDISSNGTAVKGPTSGLDPNMNEGWLRSVGGCLMSNTRLSTNMREIAKDRDVLEISKKLGCPVTEGDLKRPLTKRKMTQLAKFVRKEKLNEALFQEKRKDLSDTDSVTSDSSGESLVDARFGLTTKTSIKSGLMVVSAILFLINNRDDILRVCQIILNKFGVTNDDSTSLEFVRVVGDENSTMHEKDWDDDYDDDGNEKVDRPTVHAGVGEHSIRASTLAGIARIEAFISAMSGPCGSILKSSDEHPLSGVNDTLSMGNLAGELEQLGSLTKTSKMTWVLIIILALGCYDQELLIKAKRGFSDFLRTRGFSLEQRAIFFSCARDNLTLVEGRSPAIFGGLFCKVRELIDLFESCALWDTESSSPVDEALNHKSESDRVSTQSALEVCIESSESVQNDKGEGRFSLTEDVVVKQSHVDDLMISVATSLTNSDAVSDFKAPGVQESRTFADLLAPSAGVRSEVEVETEAYTYVGPKSKAARRKEKHLKQRTSSLIKVDTVGGLEKTSKIDYMLAILAVGVFFNPEAVCSAKSSLIGTFNTIVSLSSEYLRAKRKPEEILKDSSGKKLKGKDFGILDYTIDVFKSLIEIVRSVTDELSSGSAYQEDTGTTFSDDPNLSEKTSLKSLFYFISMVASVWTFSRKFLVVSLLKEQPREYGRRHVRPPSRSMRPEPIVRISKATVDTSCEDVYVEFTSITSRRSSWMGLIFGRLLVEFQNTQIATRLLISTGVVLAISYLRYSKKVAPIVKRIRDNLFDTSRDYVFLKAIEKSPLRSVFTSSSFSLGASIVSFSCGLFVPGFLALINFFVNRVPACISVPLVDRFPLISLALYSSLHIAVGMMGSHIISQTNSSFVNSLCLVTAALRLGVYAETILLIHWLIVSVEGKLIALNENVSSFVKLHVRQIYQMLVKLINLVRSQPVRSIHAITTRTSNWLLASKGFIAQLGECVIGSAMTLTLRVKPTFQEFVAFIKPILLKMSSHFTAFMKFTSPFMLRVLCKVKDNVINPLEIILTGFVPLASSSIARSKPKRIISVLSFFKRMGGSSLLLIGSFMWIQSMLRSNYELNANICVLAPLILDLVFFGGLWTKLYGLVMLGWILIKSLAQSHVFTTQFEASARSITTTHGIILAPSGMGKTRFINSESNPVFVDGDDLLDWSSVEIQGGLNDESLDTWSEAIEKASQEHIVLVNFQREEDIKRWIDSGLVICVWISEDAPIYLREADASTLKKEQIKSRDCWESSVSFYKGFKDVLVTDDLKRVISGCPVVKTSLGAPLIFLGLMKIYAEDFYGFGVTLARNTINTSISSYVSIMSSAATCLSCLKENIENGVNLVKLDKTMPADANARANYRIAAGYGQWFEVPQPVVSTLSWLYLISNGPLSSLYGVLLSNALGMGTNYEFTLALVSAVTGNLTCLVSSLACMCSLSLGLSLKTRGTFLVLAGATTMTSIPFWKHHQNGHSIVLEKPSPLMDVNESEWHDMLEPRNRARGWIFSDPGEGYPLRGLPGMVDNRTSSILCLKDMGFLPLCDAAVIGSGLGGIVQGMLMSGLKDAKLDCFTLDEEGFKMVKPVLGQAESQNVVVNEILVDVRKEKLGGYDLVVYDMMDAFDSSAWWMDDYSHRDELLHQFYDDLMLVHSATKKGGQSIIAVNSDHPYLIDHALDWLSMFYDQIDCVFDPMRKIYGMLWIVCRGCKGHRSLFRKLYRPGEIGFRDGSSPDLDYTAYWSALSLVDPLDGYHWLSKLSRLFKSELVYGLTVSVEDRDQKSYLNLSPDALAFVAGSEIKYEWHLGDSGLNTLVPFTYEPTSAYSILGVKVPSPVPDREFNASLDPVVASILSEAGASLSKSFDIPSQSNASVLRGLKKRYDFPSVEINFELASECAIALGNHLFSVARDTQFDFSPLTTDEVKAYVNRGSSVGYMSCAKSRTIGDLVDDEILLVEQEFEKLINGGKQNHFYHASPKVEKKEVDPQESMPSEPRLFMYKTGEVRVAEMMLTKRLNDFLGASGMLFSSTHGDVYQKAQRICESFESIPNSRAVQIEASKWDGHKEFDMFVLARIVMIMAMKGGVNGETVSRVIRSTALLDGFGTAYLCSGHVVRFIRGNQKSGSWDTSTNNKLCNTIAEIALLSSALEIPPAQVVSILAQEQSRDKPCELMVLAEGDDGLIVCEASRAEKVLSLRDNVYDSLGFPQRGSATLASCPEETDFCSNGATRLSNGICVPVREMATILGRMVMSLENNSKGATNKAMARSLTATISMAIMYWSCSSIRDIYSLVRAIVPAGIIPKSIDRREKFKFVKILGIDVDVISFDLVKFLKGRFSSFDPWPTMNEAARARVGQEPVTNKVDPKLVWTRLGDYIARIKQPGTVIWFSKCVPDEVVLRTSLSYEATQSNLVVFTETSKQYRHLMMSCPSGNLLSCFWSSLSSTLSRVRSSDVIAFFGDNDGSFELEKRVSSSARRYRGFLGELRCSRVGLTTKTSVCGWLSLVALICLIVNVKITSVIKTSAAWVGKGQRVVNKSGDVFTSTWAAVKAGSYGRPRTKRIPGISLYLALFALSGKRSVISYSKAACDETYTYLARTERRFGIFDLATKRTHLFYKANYVNDWVDANVNVDTKVLSQEIGLPESELMDIGSMHAHGGMITPVHWGGEIVVRQVNTFSDLIADLTEAKGKGIVRGSDMPLLSRGLHKANKHIYAGNCFDSKVPEKSPIIFGDSSSYLFRDIPKPWDADIAMADWSHDIPMTSWEYKSSIVVFRGGTTGYGSDEVTNARIFVSSKVNEIKNLCGVDIDFGFTNVVTRPKRLCLDICDNPGLDSLTSWRVAKRDSARLVPFMSLQAMSAFKYLLVIEGNEAPDRVLSNFLTGSLVIYVNPKFTFAFEGWNEPLIIDRVTCLRCNLDERSISEAIIWAERNQEAVLEITARARSLALELLRRRVQADYINNVMFLVNQQSGSITNIRDVVSTYTLTQGGHKINVYDTLSRKLHGSIIDMESGALSKKMLDVDIGCGVCLYSIKPTDVINLCRGLKFRETCDQTQRTKVMNILSKYDFVWDEEAYETLGSLGFGNHFAEAGMINRKEHLTIHSGCRGFREALLRQVNEVPGVQFGRTRLTVNDANRVIGACTDMASLNRDLIATSLAQNPIKICEFQHTTTWVSDASYGSTPGKKYFVKNLSVAPPLTTWRDKSYRVLVLGDEDTGSCLVVSSQTLNPHGTLGVPLKDIKEELQVFPLIKISDGNNKDQENIIKMMLPVSKSPVNQVLIELPKTWNGCATSNH